jgi:pSer/pThr/pTyr-binding forkhead associated (FHA) protein
MPIVIKVHPERQRAYRVSVNAPCTIGRSADTDLRLQDDSVSGKHAQIVRTETGFALLDLKSTNGLYCNGTCSTTIDLKEGICVYLGTTRLEFSLEEALAEKTQTLDPQRVAQITGAARTTNTSKILALVLLLCGLAWLQEFQRPADINYATYAGGLLALLLAVFGLTLLLSLFSRIHARAYRFSALFQVNLFWIWLWWLGAAILPYLVYNQPFSLLHDYALPAYVCVLLPFYFASLGHVIFSETPKQRILRNSVLVTLGLVVIVVAFQVLSPSRHRFAGISQRVVYPFWEKAPYAVSTKTFVSTLQIRAKEIQASLQKQ